MFIIRGADKLIFRPIFEFKGLFLHEPQAKTNNRITAICPISYFSHYICDRAGLWHFAWHVTACANYIYGGCGDNLGDPGCDDYQVDELLILSHGRWLSGNFSCPQCNRTRCRPATARRFFQDQLIRTHSAPLGLILCNDGYSAYVFRSQLFEVLILFS